MTNILTWRGTVGRRAYGLWGVGLFALKYNLDRLVSLALFDRGWLPWSYLDVTGIARVTELTAEDRAYGLTLVALALPFVYVGVALTLRRLRSAGLPPLLVLLFFVPLVNLLFFAVLAVVPPRPARGEGVPAPYLSRFIPRSQLGSAVLGMGVTVAVGLPLAVLSADVFASYGWSLFVGIPFAAGMVSALLYGYHARRSYGECAVVAMASVLLLALGLAVLAVEGIICLAMAAPLAVMIALVGAAFGYALQRHDAAPRTAPPALLALAVVVPALVGVEGAGDAEPPLVAVRTAVEVGAPPDAVWPHVVAFAELPPPTDWLFKTGIAYPLRAEIEGAGVGAVRHCVFTTGAFVEPVTVWDAPRRLAFTVEAQPQPMQEWGLYERVEPHHLNGYFVSERGQFLLTDVGGGRTRLEGTTWYRHHVWPNGYWRLWSDFVLHRIHLRVLRHVKARAEAT